MYTKRSAVTLNISENVAYWPSSETITDINSNVCRTCTFDFSGAGIKTIEK